MVDVASTDFEAGNKVERRLTAILAADVVGYSRLMGADEVGTLAALNAHRRDLIDVKIAEHQGRIVRLTGDGMLVEFPSVVNAVACAAAVQRGMAERNADVPTERRIEFRVGVNLGDVIVEGADIFGDGVNVAARLEGIAQPGGIAVSGTVRDHIGNRLDIAFDDTGDHTLKNIERPVRVYSVRVKSGEHAAHPALPLPDKPSIAVLPFKNLSGEPEQEYFADGMVEDITAALSRVRSFFVIACNSTLTYKGRAVNVQQASRELGVRYVLAGSVRRVRDRVRITAQLIDAVTAAHLWADHYDGIVQDVFELQDQITTNVVGAIEPSIRAAEIERARRKRPESLDAYDLVMQALPHVWSLDHLSNEKATRLLEDALHLDPAYPMALSLFAWCRGQRVVYGWSRDPDAEREEAIRKAQTAADLAEEDPFVLTVLGAALTITRQYQAGLLAVEKALALDPNSAWAWSRSGYLQIQFDRPDKAIDHFEKAIRLSPFDPLIFNSHFGIGMAHFVAGRYGDCVNWCEKALLANPKAIWINRTLAAAYVFTGQRKEAELSVRRLLDGYPGLTIPAVRSAQAWRPRVLDRLSEGLKQAGLPE